MRTFVGMYCNVQLHKLFSLIGEFFWHIWALYFKSVFQYFFIILEVCPYSLHPIILINVPYKIGYEKICYVVIRIA